MCPLPPWGHHNLSHLPFNPHTPTKCNPSPPASDTSLYLPLARYGADETRSQRTGHPRPSPTQAIPMGAWSSCRLDLLKTKWPKISSNADKLKTMRIIWDQHGHVNLDDRPTLSCTFPPFTTAFLQ